MGAFFGCVVIAGVLWYVGRKIARVLYTIGVIVETIGQRGVGTDDWPKEAEIRDKFG